MTGYVRVDTSNNIADGNVISAADLDNEFDGIQAAFNASTGHNHDGTTGEGAPISVLGPTQDVVVGASTVTPKTTNTVDIGSSSLKFKDLYLAGNASIGGTLAVTGVATLTAQPILSSLTASRAVFTDGSKGLVSNAITGTGNVVMSASPTLTGTISAEALTTSSTVTLNGGTANGVAYLNGSKVLTTGSALTFDGTTLSNTGSGDRAKFGTGSRNIYIAGDSGGVSMFDGAAQTGNGWYISGASNYVAGYVSSSERMRLTSTGLGIGTSNPATKLVVSNAGALGIEFDPASGAMQVYNRSTSAYGTMNLWANTLYFRTGVSPAINMALDSSGNVGIGTTSPAYKLDVVGDIQAQGRLLVTAAAPELLLSVPSGGLDSRIYNDGSGNLIFGNGTNSATPTERMRIDSSGNIIRGASAGVVSTGGAVLGIETLGGTTAASSIGQYAYATTNAAPFLEMGFSRNATVGSHTVVNNGDVLGAIRFSGSDGTNFVRGAQIIGVVDGTPGTNDMPGRLVFSTTADGASSPTERMRIDSSGNVGIGTSSPVEKLEVSGNAAVTGTGYLALQRQLIPVGENGFPALQFRMYSTGTTYVAGASIGATSESAWSSTSAPTRLQFFTTPSGSTTLAERMRLDSSGNLGIGTTSPSASAILDAQSTTKGVRMPNMTTTQKNAIASPAAGLMVFDTTLSKLCVYTGAAWETITSI